ncbi:helix-turn-helix domain-containing protein [Candidatus Woesearchaeota archaeon]|nr:helix-turn-helix domain-containing protein [Candidatus Woesearchaeota archaeon]
MAKEKFLLVSLKESKAKKLAQVISNETCRKILDYLAEKEATETELGKKLNIPISTVHYNLQCLMDGGLVTVEEFHYSEKGKEVNHYKLANKYIIIAPKSVYGIKEKLKSVLPVALLTAATAGIIQFVQKQKVGAFAGARQAVMEAAPTLDAAPLIEKAAEEAAPVAAEAAREAVVPTAAPNIALWFLIGAVSAIIIYMIIDYIRSKKK